MIAAAGIIVVFIPLLIAGIVHLIRLGFKYLIGKSWARWYIRRSVDTAMICYLVLWFMSMNATNPFTSLYESKIWSEGNLNSLLEYEPAAMQLRNLEALNYFIGHFFQVVIMLPLFVGAIGYVVSNGGVKSRSK